MSLIVLTAALSAGRACHSGTCSSCQATAGSRTAGVSSYSTECWLSWLQTVYVVRRWIQASIINSAGTPSRFAAICHCPEYASASTSPCHTLECRSNLEAAMCDDRRSAGWWHAGRLSGQILRLVKLPARPADGMWVPSKGSAERLIPPSKQLAGLRP